MTERYDFAISLRIWHPSMSPGLITRRLQLTPRLKKTTGAARRTPRGTLLGGVNPESYWVADVVRHGVGSAGRRSSAEQHVERFCKKLVRHAEFFRRVHRDGGHVRVWVDSHSRRNYTFELTPQCLKSLEAAGVALVIDVYPYPQNRRDPNSGMQPTAYGRG
jgi:hypothetical protein